MSIFQELRKTTDHLGRQFVHHHDPNAPMLRADGLSVRYESGVALEGISFELTPGERLAIVGPNGAGKSTLIKIIAGIQTATSGTIEVFGNDPDGHICIAYVPQRSQVDWHFPVTVADVVMMGRVGQLGLFRNPKARDWEIVNHALDVVGMSGFAKRQIDQLSGGQQQRMFIARALAQEAELILMDEPMTGLDMPSQDKIFEILDRLREENVTVLISLHDLKMAAERFDRVMLLKKKLLAIGSPAEALLPTHLLKAYGEQMPLISTDDGLLALGDTCCDGERNYAH